jgi:hypothetical protein
LQHSSLPLRLKRRGELAERHTEKGSITLGMACARWLALLVWLAHSEFRT